MPKPRSSNQNQDELHEKVLDDVIQLINLMGQTGLAELELETTNLKMMLRKEAKTFVMPTSRAGMPHPGMMYEDLSGPGHHGTGHANGTMGLTDKPEPIPEVVYHHILSPMAGTFYRAPAPNSPPYVKEGDNVEFGQTVCIVEAMKLMNEIKADKAGRVVKILLQNMDPVEKDTILFYIQPENPK